MFWFPIFQNKIKLPIDKILNSGGFGDEADEEFEVKEILEDDFFIEGEMSKVRALGNQRRLLLANVIHSFL